MPIDWDRYYDPPDEDYPECPECGSELYEVEGIPYVRGMEVEWECRNPECSECANKYRVVPDDE